MISIWETGVDAKSEPGPFLGTWNTTDKQTNRSVILELLCQWGKLFQNKERNASGI